MGVQGRDVAESDQPLERRGLGVWPGADERGIEQIRAADPAAGAHDEARLGAGKGRGEVCGPCRGATCQEPAPRKDGPREAHAERLCQKACTAPEQGAIERSCWGHDAQDITTARWRRQGAGGDFGTLQSDSFRLYWGFVGLPSLVLGLYGADSDGSVVLGSSAGFGVFFGQHVAPRRPTTSLRTPTTGDERAKRYRLARRSQQS